ncbi:2-oxoacid ferredoxin oxidoreductase [Chromobacterium violaceum]|uniref:indolepyruvate ferredoxin oxidoreductase family protein n=1 Tax=Chromobacterium violaceum TaxID=536 RepID=UPI000C124727|nr:indolepyruvate ferredoxin oxidoreductase family protein [Chromobacterium violaceum]ATP28411.1 2-oxoacid ferredoxin oxidoreductase [Chromobacterium violaceum]ATP32320.1 2-oxoacid ferredoxin oxidoreductase [Chromobacterium violaceum]
MEIDNGFSGADRYEVGISRPGGRIMLSGTQAIVRMMLAQAAADREAGLNTAGFASGYRGSPLGAVDMEMWKAKRALEQAGIRFLPAINEELAATAVLGTQRVGSDADRKVDGVFGLWYGKGPGVDRAGDALHHGNAYGSSEMGGVLVIVGDDHGCVSSSMSHQSDQTLIAWGMPVIHPASVADYEAYGLWGWAASRHSGLWIGFKAISETVESSVSCRSVERRSFSLPPVDPGNDGLHWRWPDLPGPQMEQRMVFKLEAFSAFARANPLDKLTFGQAAPRLLIAAVGKAHGDVMEALRQLGAGEAELESAGIALLQVGLVWPLSPLLAELAETAEAVLVVEEKAAVAEALLKQHLYNVPEARRPVVIGKEDEEGRPLLPVAEELRPSRLAPLLLARLQALGVSAGLPACWQQPVLDHPAGLLKRTPYFCSGCPHNLSTLVPEGSRAQLGIGCHAMAARIPERHTSGSVQMGGEGVDWLGAEGFVDTGHIFQNMGDGTFFHSGHLAIRQAVAAGSNITYKLLYNDAVAMTGGQPIDGKLTVPQIVRLALAERVARVVVVADDPGRYVGDNALPGDTRVYHRDRMDEVQRELRELNGVSLLIYDQVCATEARRRRKRKQAPALNRSVVINEQVCEGCGDCQKASNCLSVVPLKTDHGVKRRIDQHSCNTDMSCLKGFCPSFVTLRGRPRVKRSDAELQRAVGQAVARLPEPGAALGTAPYEILLTGIGGTGVVTVSSIVATAAHLQQAAVSVLDFTGFAQKGGSVLSHIRLASDRAQLHQNRIDRGGADALIAADLVVATEREALECIRAGRTRIAANLHETQVGLMLRDPTLQVDSDGMLSLLEKRSGAQALALDAKALAERFATPLQANVLLLGFAWQAGLVPLRLDAVRQAIRLQGGSGDDNLAAFDCGRLAAGDPDALRRLDGGERTQDEFDDYERLKLSRMRLLAEYQNPEYAARYLRRLGKVEQATRDWQGEDAVQAEALRIAVARNLYKLMACKDEYEVARQLSDRRFLQRLAEEHGSLDGLRFHLAPDVFNFWRRQPRKVAVGRWILPLMRGLARLRFLRGSMFDPFAGQEDRRAERQLLADYESLLDTLCAGLERGKLAIAVKLARLPESVRGYGHVKLAAIPAMGKRKAELLLAFSEPSTVQPLPEQAQRRHIPIVAR